MAAHNWNAAPGGGIGGLSRDKRVTPPPRKVPAMRSILLFSAAALALTACNQATPGDVAASATPSAPATMATTNAKIEPVPGSTNSAPSPTPSITAMSATSTPVPADELSSDCGARKAAEAHPIEKTGAQLRAMMPWIGANQLVDKARN